MGVNELLAPTHLWLDGTLVPGMAVEIEAGRVTRVRPARDEETPDARPFLLMPACTDLQVNGSGGIMLNDGPSPEAIASIVASQRSIGTGWTMPTLITAGASDIEAAARAAVEAFGLEGFLGLHIEGPHINPARKGTHDPRVIRPMDAATLAALERLRGAGVPVMLTLAPEMVPAETIRRIADLGVVVSAGHTAASAAETRAGLEAGVSCFTHLYNAMPPMTSREPGVVGAAIGSEAYCGLIADGIHVDWTMLSIAIRARPRARRMFLVSDAMATVAGPDHFTLYGERIALRDGALVNANGSLAGAHITMADSLVNAATRLSLPLAEAVAMACEVPHRAMGLEPPAIATGRARGEMIAFDADWRRLF